MYTSLPARPTQAARRGRGGHARAVDGHHRIRAPGRVCGARAPRCAQDRPSDLAHQPQAVHSSHSSATTVPRCQASTSGRHRTIRKTVLFSRRWSNRVGTRRRTSQPIDDQARAFPRLGRGSALRSLRHHDRPCRSSSGAGAIDPSHIHNRVVGWHLGGRPERPVGLGPRTLRSADPPPWSLRWIGAT
jgi:hypothetical protein